MLKIVNDNTEIDIGYVTCAEYQLFINEKLEVGEYYQPDHWKSLKHAPEDADKPITGVRASDAEAFCKWLTQRETRPGYGYRLPTLDEVESNPCPDNYIGCWCTYEGKQIVGGIKPQQWQVWQNELVNLYNFDNDLTYDPSLDRDPHFNLNLAWHLDFTQFHLQILARSQEFVRDYTHELNLINKLTRSYKYISTRSRSWTSITNRILPSIFEIVHNITTPLIDFLVSLFRGIIQAIYALLSVMVYVLSPIFRVVHKIGISVGSVLISLKDTVFQGIRAVFSDLVDIFTATTQIHKKNYNPDDSPEQILQHALARVAEFERISSIVLLSSQNRTRTNFRSRVRGNNPDINSIFALLLSVERDYLNSFHAKLTKKSSIFSKNSALKFLSNLKVDFNSVIDFDRNLDIAFACAIDRRFDFSRRDLYSICRYLLTISTFYILLSRDYKKELKSRELPYYQNFSRNKCQQLGHEHQMKSGEVFKLHAIFFLIIMRYEGQIAAWEGIRIVRERIEG